MEDWQSSRSLFNNSQTSDFVSNGISEVGSVFDDGNESVYHPVVAKRENRAVARAKLLLAFFLFLGVAVSVGGVYSRVRTSEIEEFRTRVSIEISSLSDFAVSQY